MYGEPSLTEKKCSKCGEWSWDNETGLYLDPCPGGGKHNTNGGTYIDGVRQPNT